MSKIYEEEDYKKGTQMTFMCLKHNYLIRISFYTEWGFPHSSVGKESACNAGDLGSIPGLGRSPGEGNSNPLQYSCWKNPMDRGASQVTAQRVGCN